MKVLLCCAGGLSSSILMKKMKTWADAHGEDLEIQAMGTGEAVEPGRMATSACFWLPR